MNFRQPGFLNETAPGNGATIQNGHFRPVQLDVEFNGNATDPWGRQRIALTLTAQIDRRDFGLVWNAPMENGGFMIGYMVMIEIEAEAVRQ